MNFIEQEREISNSNYLINELIMSGWLEKDVVLVNCGPQYSSRLTQLINHKTSYLNGNELFEQISLELPGKGMNQVLCYDFREYISFDRYLAEWIAKHVTKTAKFLFITNTIFSGRKLNKVKMLMKAKIENLDNMKFLSLYTMEGSIVKPDYTHRTFNKDNKPVFFWENTNIK
jgi:hypothetical protein